MVVIRACANRETSDAPDAVATGMERQRARKKEAERRIQRQLRIQENVSQVGGECFGEVDGAINLSYL